MDGQMRWSSLGIQVGEAGSASGILGIWTGIDHELQDPAGAFLPFPFALYALLCP